MKMTHRKNVLSCLNCVRDSEGNLLMLNFVGVEVAVNGVHAYLVGNRNREKRYGSSMVHVHLTEHHGSSINITLQKKTKYKFQTSKLDDGLVNAVLTHPQLLPTDDNPDGFYILTDSNDVPEKFFHRLNNQIETPLLPEWAEFLWRDGQREQENNTYSVVQVVDGRDNKGNPIYKDRDKWEFDYVTPIKLVESYGDLICYMVIGRPVENAWTNIVRENTEAYIRLEREAVNDYRSGPYRLYHRDSCWRIEKDRKMLIDGTDLMQTMRKANAKCGLMFKGEF